MKKCKECKGEIIKKKDHPKRFRERIFCSQNCAHASGLRKTHGMTDTRFYRIWANMKTRCQNSNSQQAYYKYGARGIKVCKRWFVFQNFQDDMYESYLEHIKGFGEKSTQIDRKDNNGNYEKSNCSWATSKEQQRNKRNNQRITFRGDTKCLTDWAEENDISVRTLWWRIVLAKWPIEKALTTPVRKR